MNGRRVIVYSVNKMQKELTPASVTLIHPNVKKTDSLLVVIKGEHFGTFVRRLTSKVVGGVDVAVCRVVKRVPKAADIVTLVTLELPADCLTGVVEEDFEKKLNIHTLKEERNALRQ